MLDGATKTCQARDCGSASVDGVLCEKHVGMLGKRLRWYRAALYDDDLPRAREFAARALDIREEALSEAPSRFGDRTPKKEMWGDARTVLNPPPVPAPTSPTMAFCPHKPHPKQQAFLDLTCEEAFFGGAAGGGKSDALLMAALQYVHIPGYCALILRRSYADLSKPGAVLQRSKDWLMSRPGAKWSEQNKRWTFETPCGGTSYLQFGYLSVPDDKYNFQSTEYQFVGFDELTQFEEESYLYLFSRLRRLAGVEIPIRMRSASNPGGRGHSWVMRRFVKPGSPERVFVPSRMEDNPSLDADAYRQALLKLDEETRTQLLDGVWANGKPKYGSVVSVELPAPVPATYSVLRIDESRCVRLGFALIKDKTTSGEEIVPRVTLVEVDPYAIPSASDRLVVCTASIARDVRKIVRRGRAAYVDPKKIRAVYLRGVCSRIDVASGLDFVWSALGTEENDLPPVEDAILDALAHAPTSKALSTRVDRTDLSEQELLDAENGSTSSREWWRRPERSIGLRES